MAIETERKFLVRDDSWRKSVSRSDRLRQGYLSSESNCSVRVRTSNERAWLNIKSVAVGVQRHEYEYEIPLADGNALLDTLSRKPLIEKTRHYVTVGEHCWEVDEFEGDNAGLIVAEVELDHADEVFETPDWAADEVTDDPRYYNTRLSVHPYKDW